MSHDRRTFLATLGAAALGATSAWRSAFSWSLTRVRPIGLELYTVRKPAAADLAGTLAQVASIGYKEVELAGYYNHTAAEFRALLDANGLKAPSGHIGIDLIETKPDTTFADAHTVGHEWITVPSLPPLPSGKRTTVDDWKQVAAQFNRAALQVKQAGFRFAYHNHNTEFRPVGDTTPLEILLAETDPSLVSFEMDIYWVVNGGGDPLALLSKHPGRFKMLHLKDSMGPPEQKMADVGAGVIDFKPILAKAAGVEHYFVEHDNPPDPMASAAASYKYLSNLDY